MGDGDLQIGFDTSGVVNGVRAGEVAIDQFVGSVQQLDRAISTLGTASKTRLSQMAEAMKGVETSQRSVASAFKSANQLLLTEMKEGEEQTLKLVRDQNTALSQKYQQRLAEMGRLSSQELQVWKNHGVQLGGIQALQLRAYEAGLRKERGLQEDHIREIVRSQRETENLIKTRASSATKMDLDETRMLLGMPDRNEMKTLAAQIKSQMQEGISKEKLRTSSATKMGLDETRMLLGLPSQSDMDTLAAQIKSQMQARMVAIQRQAQAQVNAAMQTAGTYQVYNPKTGIAGAVRNVQREAPTSLVPPVPPKELADMDKLASSFKRANDSANDLHSGIRGLASGFGALWLTWGNLGPLFIGAAISNSFVQTAKTGMEVAHTMEIIKNLGGNTAEELRLLTNELDRLGKSGPFGPLEVASAMKTLSLAGLKANEILAVTQTVLDFSIAGTTNIETAAKTLMTVSTAFGMGAEGFSKVADVISKAAAISLTSVESFSEAMKTASVINAQYGVSLEDTATAIAAMSQLGIEGSAAGTALRNAYADLSGRTKEVAAALKSVGIEARDANGNFKPLMQVISDLNEKTSKMTGTSRKDFLQAVLSERGAKGIIELLRMIQTETDRTGKSMSNAMATMQAELYDYYGFAAINSAKMAQTAENQFKALKATISTSMNEAYREMEPNLLLMIDSLKKVFASPEFVQGLSSMVEGVARLGMVISQNLDVIKGAIGIYVALKTVQLSSVVALDLLAGAKGLYTAATQRSTVALAAEAAAEAAGNTARAGKAAGMLGLARLIPGLNLAVGLGTAAWMAYDWWRSKANDTAGAAVDLYNTNVVKTLNDEAERLEKLNKLREEGLSLAEAEARVRGGEAKSAGTKYIADLEKEAETAKARYLGMQAEINKSSETRGLVVAANVRTLEELRSKAVAAARAVADAKIDADRAAADTEQAALRVSAARKKGDSLNRPPAIQPPGTESFTAAEEKTRKAQIDSFVLHNDNLLKEIEKRHKAELALLKQKETDSVEILNAQRDAELISEGTHFGKLLNLTRQYEDNKLAAIEQARSAYNAEYLSDRLNMVMELENWKAANPNASAEQIDQAVAKLRTGLDNLKNTADTVFEGFNNEAKAATGVTDKLLAKAAIAAQKDLRALKKASEDFWVAEEQGRAKAQAAADLAETLAYADPRYAAYISAAADAQAKLTDEYNRLTPELRRAESALIDFTAEQLLVGPPTAEASAYIATMAEKVQALRTQMDALKSGRGTAEAGQAAVVAFDRAEQKKLVSGLADAVEAGLYEGGKAGRTKLRDLIVAELKKPIRIVLEAGIKAMLGGGTGSALAGDAAGGAASSALSSALFGGASLSAIGSSIGTGIMATMTGQSVGAAAGAYSAAGMTGVSAGLTVGAALPWVAGAMALVQGLSRTLKDTGIQGSFGGEGFTGESYKFYKGGFLRSDKTKTEALTAPLESLLDSSYVAIRDNTKKMAQELGLSAGAVDTFTSSIKVSFTGLTEKQIQEKLVEEFGKVGDSMAELVLGAGKTAKDLEDLYNAVMQQRYDLETKLLELQGNTVELRRRERGALHETNRAIYDQIKALEDQQAALSNLTTSFESAGSASALLAKYGGTGSAKSTLASLNSSYRFLTSIADKTEVLGQIAELEASLAAEVNQKKIEAMSKELDMAKQMLEAAKGIKNYLDGLKLGSLSTLSPEQMLQEASSQYQSTLLKAKSGDADSAAALQGVADAYLQQAQSYYGSNTNYAGIFSTVTSQLETFSDRTIAAYDPMVTKLEKQISLLQKQTSISQATLDKMEELDALAQDQFAADLKAAAAQAIGLDSIATALKGLPPALAGLLGESLTSQLTALADKYMASESLRVSSGAVTETVSRVAAGGLTVREGAVNLQGNSILQNLGPRALYDSAKAANITMSEVDRIMGWPTGTSKGWAEANKLPTFAAGGSYEGGMALVGEEGPELINFRNPGQVYTANQTAAILGGDKETAALLKELLAELRSLRSQQGNENSAQVTRLTGIERKLASIESTGVLEKAR